MSAQETRRGADALTNLMGLVANQQFQHRVASGTATAEIDGFVSAMNPNFRGISAIRLITGIAPLSGSGREPWEASALPAVAAILSRLDPETMTDRFDKVSNAFVSTVARVSER